MAFLGFDTCGFVEFVLVWPVAGLWSAVFSQLWGLYWS